jgi:uncharacterized repeat protein (TIGR04052 family)
MHAVFALVALAACEPAVDTDTADDVELTIPVAARIGGADVACGTSYTPPMGSSTMELLDLRLYVADLQLITASGTAVDATFVDDDTWQSPRVALLDYEDGTAGCAAAGNAGLNDELVVTVAEATEDDPYTGVSFTLGVPFDLNHLDSATSDPPLDVPSMYWAWQTGHKFVRLDMQNDQEAPDDKWFFHLGSLGCSSASAATAPAGPCARPNTPVIAVDMDPLADTLVLDLDGLLGGVDIGTNAENTPTGCMSNALDDGECPSIFANLGMSWDDGTCVDGCADQKAFTAP